MANRSEVEYKPSPLRKLLWMLLVLGLLVGTGVVLWQAYSAKRAAILAEGEALKPQEAPSSPSEDSTSMQAPAEEFVSRAETPSDLPPLPGSLSESDGWLRQQLPVLDRNPELTRWLNETPDLLRRFVVLVNEAARGKVASGLFGFWSPSGPIQVKETAGGEYVLDPASYHRYDQLADAVEALDVELAWRLYRHLKPLIDEVYAEFGQPGTDFDQVLLNAIEHLLKTPQPEGEIRLIKPAVMYQYSDPKLEALSAAQKQLLRMGPVNAAIVKHKLGLVREHLLNKG